MRGNALALFQAVRNDLSGVIDTSVLNWGPDLSAREVACYMLLNSVVKKWNDSEKTTPQQNEVAFKKFVDANNRCLDWVDRSNTSLDEVLLGTFKKRIHEFFDPCFRPEACAIIYDYGHIYRSGGCGPGASRSARDNDLYTKWYDSPLSVTKRLSDVFDIINRSGSERVNGPTRTGFDADGETYRRSQGHGIVIQDCSALSFVPKTTAVSRSICTEPSINMWMQLGFGRLIAQRLSALYGIDISKQEDVNKTLARQGSIEDNLSTLDLESASDSISLAMLRHLLPRQVVSVLEVLRSPRAETPIGEVTLHMVSSMGNGFTFPLMTAILASAVAAVYDISGVPFQGKGAPEGRTFGVYGDDIICVRACTGRLMRLLNLLGFVVNNGKSFVEGRFKESCGGDYFNGVDVRGVYCKKLRPRNKRLWAKGDHNGVFFLPDLFVLYNTLFRWQVRHGVTLNDTMRLILTWIESGHKKRQKFLVPFDESDDAGLQCPLAVARNAGQSKVGFGRHGRFNYRPHVTLNSNMFVVTGGFCWTFKGQVARAYNPDGLVSALLHGSLRDGFVVLKPKSYASRTADKTTVRWDYLPPDKWCVNTTIDNITRLSVHLLC